MKKLVTVVLLSLIFISCICLWICSNCSNDKNSDMSTPENSIKGFLQAKDDEDVDKWVTYWLKEEDALDRDKASVKALMEESSYEVSNVEITLVTQTDDAAVVEVSYHLRSNVMAMFWEEDLQETAQLTKVDDKWLIVQMR